MKIFAASIIRAIALMMEAARTSETFVNFYQTTRRYNPEVSHLHTHRRENLKSYFYQTDWHQTGATQKTAIFNPVLFILRLV
jgi:hypothetical protein